MLEFGRWSEEGFRFSYAGLVPSTYAPKSYAVVPLD